LQSLLFSPIGYRHPFFLASDSATCFFIACKKSIKLINKGKNSPFDLTMNPSIIENLPGGGDRDWEIEIFFFVSSY